MLCTYVCTVGDLFNIDPGFPHMCVYVAMHAYDCLLCLHKQVYTYVHMYLHVCPYVWVKTKSLYNICRELPGQPAQSSSCFSERWKSPRSSRGPACLPSQSGRGCILRPFVRQRRKERRQPQESEQSSGITSCRFNQMPQWSLSKWRQADVGSQEGQNRP